MVDKYMEEMVDLKTSEKLNKHIYQQFAKEMDSAPSLVRGTGFGRQFVHHTSRGNILDRPSRCSRPLWSQKPFNILVNLYINTKRPRSSFLWSNRN